MNPLKVIRLRNALRSNGYEDIIELAQAKQICSDYEVTPRIRHFTSTDQKVALLSLARHIVLRGGY
jgi:hypothetical protein